MCSLLNTLADGVVMWLSEALPTSALVVASGTPSPPVGVSWSAIWVPGSVSEAAWRVSLVLGLALLEGEGEALVSADLEATRRCFRGGLEGGSGESSTLRLAVPRLPSRGRNAGLVPAGPWSGPGLGTVVARAVSAPAAPWEKLGGAVWGAAPGVEAEPPVAVVLGLGRVGSGVLPFGAKPIARVRGIPR